MIDESVPYIEIIMRRNPGLSLPVHPLPEGYSFKLYEPGNEKDWAQIENSVNEFGSYEEALEYFTEEFIPYKAELMRRCIFVKSPDGELVGNAMAWWDYAGQRRHPLVHWVAVKPNQQGKGLGKALTAEVLRLMTVTDGDGIFYLKTQTSSHKAVGIYEWAGFFISDEKDILGHKNDKYEEAVALIKSLRNS
jgi:GNAT superfamily N-acetyltransferase